MKKRTIKLISILAVLTIFCYLLIFACPKLNRILVSPNPATINQTITFAIEMGALEKVGEKFVFTSIQYELTDPNSIKTTLDAIYNTPLNPFTNTVAGLSDQKLLAQMKTKIFGVWHIKLKNI